MKAKRQGARRQLEQFLSTLFLSDELIEIRWIEQAEHQRQRKTPSVCSRPATEVSTETILARTAEAAALARQLGKPARDRSRRDFAITCDLLRLGLTGEEIWPLVCGSSKFESNGRPYFDVTIANAERSILLDQSTAGPAETLE
jgi:hypothetical protein